MLKERSLLGTNWDYRTSDTKEYTHGIHPYPAMMIPQVARRLIHTYGREGDVLFDPYCGTGTTLLEGMLADLRSLGTDLNPLARLIARTKTNPLDPARIGKAIEDFIGFEAGNPAGSMPQFPNVDYWFSERVQRGLSSILDYIEHIHETDIADFFRVAFSLTVRKVSWTKNSEFKLVRMPGKAMESHNPDVFAIMLGILSENRVAYMRLHRVLGESPSIPAVHDFNSVTEVPQHVLAPESVDLVVTSPPYGDSKTTVAYGQFSRLSSQWLGYENASRVDNTLMGGTKLAGKMKLGVEELDEVIDEIANADVKRACEVASFFVDYRKSIANVSRVVKPGGHACYVVGNRTVKGLQVPTSAATAAFFEANDFDHVDTFQRNIPNKRMPSVNSPTNIPGKVGSTMKSEYIVICRRNA